MNASEHPGERLGDLLDARLSAADAAEIERHLAGCAECRDALEWLAAGRSASRAVGRADRAPADLRTGVMAALDEIDRAAGPAQPVRVTRRALWIGLAAAAAVVLYVARPRREGAVGPVDLAHAEFLAVRGSAAALALRTSDAAELERYFSAAATGQRIRVIDLGMMGWTLEGGVWRPSRSLPVAVYTYRSSANAYLVCQMYRGQLTDLPPADDVRRENAFEFRTYQRNGTTLVFWQEGAQVCVLAADLPAAEVLGLAIAKAMIPA